MQTPHRFVLIEYTANLLFMMPKERVGEYGEKLKCQVDRPSPNSSYAASVRAMVFLSFKSRYHMSCTFKLDTVNHETGLKNTHPALETISVHTPLQLRPCR